MKKVFMIVSLFATTAFGQTLSGSLIREFRIQSRPEHGMFTVYNDSLKPMLVAFTTKSARLVDGKIIYSNVQPDEVVRFSDSAVKLAPRSGAEIQFDAHCQVDCTLALFSTFTPQVKPGEAGLRFGITLPTILYFCHDSAKDCRERTMKRWEAESEPKMLPMPLESSSK